MENYSSQIRRGAVFYINECSTGSTGSEQKSGRPAIIISNNVNNTHSTVVEVVYLTTAKKHHLPTHFTVRSTNCVSTALCEQIFSVAKARVGDFVGTLTKEETEALNKCLAISLGLEEPKSKETDEESIRLKVECEMYKKMYQDLLEKVIGN